MTITCKVTLNGTALYPMLPITRKPVQIRESKRMVNGQLRVTQRAQKYTFSLRLDDADETERSAWLTAASVTSSVTFIDELGVSRTVVVSDTSEDLSRTEPAVEESLSTTGAGYYDLRIDLEEV